MIKTLLFSRKKKKRIKFHLIIPRRKRSDKKRKRKKKSFSFNETGIGRTVALFLERLTKRHNEWTGETGDG